MNLAERIELSCTKYPRQQLIYDGQIITYAELWDKASRVRQAFWDLGVRPGDRVVLQMPKCLEFIYAHLANLQLGSISIPLNPTYTPEEIAYFLADSGAKVFITDQGQADFAQPGSADFPKLEYLITVASSVNPNAGNDNKAGKKSTGNDNHTGDSAAQAGSTDSNAGNKAGKNSIGTTKANADHTSRVLAFSALWSQSPPKSPAANADYPAKPTDTGLIIYTSGTTGRSKGAMLSHENLLATIEGLHTVWGHSDQDTLLHVLPIFHVHGLIFAFHGALHTGMKIIMRSKFEVRDTLDCIERHGCTVFMGVPTMYHRLLQVAKAELPPLKTMRLWISGSAPLAAATFEQFKQKYGHPVLERYGMSETGINTSNPLNGERKPGSVGLPLPGVGLRLVGIGDTDVKLWEVGEVWVKGKNVFQGYWQMPAKTRESFKGGWFRTGDLGYQDTDGYLFLIGRSKDLIISGGMNVYPKEIESVIELSAAVAEAAVVGLPDDDLGERVVAYIVAKTGQTIDLAEIAGLCQAKLAGYKRPKALYVIDQMPRNTMGKLMKNRLRTRDLEK